MPLTVINGQFRVVGAAPDGDSIRFYPDTPDAFRTAGLTVRTNKSGGAQLRLEGIDSLETHYTPRVGGLGQLHQPAEFADQAAQRLPELLGFTSITRGADQVVTASTPDSAPGYILTRFADKYGRCVAFAFPGARPHTDLSSVFVKPADLAASANSGMLAAGLAYPTYYSKLFPDLRNALTAAYRPARDGQHGLWAVDTTETGFTVEDLATLTDQVVILPKLFRRLVDYLAINDGDPSLAGFGDYLATVNDRLIIASTAAVTGFDNVLQIDGQTVRMTHPPEDLIFIES
jgi:endonuclease YncB( thermonuclease family)